jgi:hypothetical protein
MSELHCAYCEGGGPITREHLWPAALHERFLKAEAFTKNAFWLRRLNKEIGGEPTIRDVCKGCNNGFISTLERALISRFRRKCL